MYCTYCKGLNGEHAADCVTTHGIDRGDLGYDSDLDKCPSCGGPADNGNDRCIPPSAYWCSKCLPLAGTFTNNVIATLQLNNAALIALQDRLSFLEVENRMLRQHGKFQLGDRVRKTKGSQWKGTVVGFYSTKLTPEGYAVESDTEVGSVQIYPVGALEYNVSFNQGDVA